jgi:phosphatidylglycerol lysyltransferase
MESALREKLRWLGPLAALAVFAGAAYMLHRQLTQFRLHDVLEEIRAIPTRAVIEALVLTVSSYWLLGFYDVLGLRYAKKTIPYAQKVFTAFIAYAFGHNLTLAGFTGAAIRLRLYAANGLTAIEVATVTAFCSATALLGLGTLAGVSLVAAPRLTGAALHLGTWGTVAVGALILGIVGCYVLWASLAKRSLAVGGWALHAPGLPMAAAQIVLGAMDFVVAAAVLWVLLPPEANVAFSTFTALYAAAVGLGFVSSVPGGLGIFEATVVLLLPQVPPDRLLGSLLLYRAIYYFVPLLAGALLFALQELVAQRAHLARVRELAKAYVAPIVPQVAATLTFVAGCVLLFSGATPTVDARLATLRSLLPLAVLEASHLVGSLIGLGLVVLANALRRRVSSAYHVTLTLLVAGAAASLLKGLDVEEALLLTLVAAVLLLGGREFYRPASILAERFTPGWAMSIVGVIAATVWIGLLSYRNVDYSQDLWWTFAFDGDAPRMLRAALVVGVIGAALLLLNLFKPARPEPVVADGDALYKARAVIATTDQTLANAALMGDKRLLFSDDGAAFLMYQISGRSWVSLGDPVGTLERADELVWRFRELSDRHGGWTVFYHASRERLPRYIDLGLAAFKLGEEARVPLDQFSLDGSARSELRQDHRRAQRDGATFEVVPAAAVPEVLSDLERVSDHWLTTKATSEKRFSVGSFTRDYVQSFDVAVVRRDGEIVAFANLWSSGTKHELSVDLMRFGNRAPRSAMDFLFAELMLWGRNNGYGWFNLGMAPLAGLEEHPLAPAWHRVGNFVFRHGEHFYNFEGLRQYKAKFRPVWEPKYLVAPGGIALPRILLDVSGLIAGGIKELFAK